MSNERLSWLMGPAGEGERLLLSNNLADHEVPGDSCAGIQTGVTKHHPRGVEQAQHQLRASLRRERITRANLPARLHDRWLWVAMDAQPVAGAAENDSRHLQQAFKVFSAAMAVPRYTLFVEPILRFLAQQESPVATADVYEAAARELQLTDDLRAATVRTGALVYKNRASWGLNWLKRSGLAEAPAPGTWRLTASGKKVATEGISTAQLLARFSAQVEARPSRTAVRRPARRPSDDSGPAPAVGGNRKAYRLPARTLAVGGQADVFEAVRKSDNKPLVLKRSRNKHFQNRMRREIEIQSALQHVNIMPIVDWDRTEFSWYVMPRGRRTMAELPRPIDPTLLFRIVKSVVSALEFAHAAGHPHRDVKPQNVIELDDDDGDTRWVLADWGLTRRAQGTTTAKWTKTGQLLGSEGFAPPEAYRDAHSIGIPGDVYALGQLIAWAVGVEPIPNVSSTVPGPWQQVVSSMTQQDPQGRPQSMAEVRRALAEVFGSGAGEIV
jgi:protein kinase-like protein/Mrr restriction endonuclease-like protein